MNRATDKTTGVLLAVMAYGMWGAFPLYFRLLRAMSPWSIVAHRVFWSAAAMVVILGVLGRLRQVREAFRRPRVLAVMGLAIVLLSINWLAFVYAVVSRQVIQSSLGYFLNPLISVMLGVIFLGERPRRLQVAAFVLALMGVGVLGALVGEFPWIALTVAFSFGFYGLVKKLAPLDSLVGLTVETLLLAPVAIGWIIVAGVSPIGNMSLGEVWLLLILAGPITAAPLMLFGAATKRLPLATVGMLQYITPTGQFLCAVIAFQEPCRAAQWISFSLVWTAVVIYCFDSYRAVRMAPPPAETP